MKTTVCALALWFAAALPAAAQMVVDPDRTMRMDGHCELRARADRILFRLLDSAEELAPARQRFAWEVQIVDDGIHDAEAFAGGQIRLSARFVARLSLDDAELAMLLAHEVAHVLTGDARQQSEGWRGDRRLQALLVGGALEPRGPHRGRAESNRRARQQELDADARGFALATRAGYAPGDLRHFFRKVRASFGDLVNATHPSVSERLSRLPAASKADSP